MTEEKSKHVTFGLSSELRASPWSKEPQEALFAQSSQCIPTHTDCIVEST